MLERVSPAAFLKALQGGCHDEREGHGGIADEGNGPLIGQGEMILAS